MILQDSWMEGSDVDELAAFMNGKNLGSDAECDYVSVHPVWPAQSPVTTWLGRQLCARKCQEEGTRRSPGRPVVI